MFDGLRKQALDRIRRAIRNNPSALKSVQRFARSLAETLIGGMYYDAAKTGRRTENWYTSPATAQTIGTSSLYALRNRSRDLVRNNPYASHYVHTMAGNLVGPTMIPTPLTPSREAERAIAVWKRHQLDLLSDGSRTPATAIILQAAMAWMESGEALMIRRPARMSDGLTVPMQVELLESDLLDHTQNGSDPRVVNGVELDARGKIAAYHLLNEHPGAGGITGAIASGRTRTPAEDVAHLYMPTRPGQRRGVPWMAPVMMALRDLDDYRDAERVRKKIESSLAAFIIGGGDGLDLSAPEDNGLGEVAIDADGDPIETFYPGMIAYLTGDKQVVLNNPKGVGGYNEFITTELHGIATGLMIPYALLTGDLSSVNYSSIRAGMLEFHRTIKVLRELYLIPRICQPMWSWVMEQAYLVGEVDSPDIPVIWSGQRFESVDPLKEAQADLVNLQIGAKTLRDVVAERGGDLDDVLKEMAATNEKLAAAGISLAWQQPTPPEPSEQGA